MNADAIEYIRDTMGYEDVVIQVITYTTWCDPPRPELSVSFTDESDKYCDNEDYLALASPIGKVFILKKEIDVTGPIAIRYEKHPWIERLELDGLQPRTPVREGYGVKNAKSFAESLSKVYSRAYEDYAAMCSDEFKTDENVDGLDAVKYFSAAAVCFVNRVANPTSLPMYKKFCGLTENIWRYGTVSMHDISLETMLPIIESDSKAKEIFYNTITPEFREYIEENGYSDRKSC